MNIAVLASGGGSNFQALIDKKCENKLNANFSVLICNNSSAKALLRAKTHNIDTLHIAPSHFDNEDTYSKALLKELTSRRVELIVLAGYMKIIPKSVVNSFHNRIINIHPSLLPSFGGKGMYGKYVHQAVLDYGAKVSGISIHFVDEKYDHGPIIFQKVVEVLDDDDTDSLAARVLVQEHENYWRVIESIAQGQIAVKNRKVTGRVI